MQGAPVDFEALARLRNLLAAVRRGHVPTMNHYVSQGAAGFWHQPSRRDKASLSSTATCVSSLVRAGLWKHKSGMWANSKAIAERLLTKPWKSAGLDPDNPFGLSFIAEGVLDLIEADQYEDSDEHKKIVLEEICPLLEGEILHSSGSFAVPGSVAIRPYPPSAYLTQLAFRVLARAALWGRPLADGLAKQVKSWAISEMHRQVALISTRSRIADPLQLAYAIVLSSSVGNDESTSPEEKSLIREALRIFFEAQQPDGFWRQSQPIFHYPTVGNALCFEYELLTQLLSCSALQDELLNYLPKLGNLVTALSQTAFDLGAQDSGRATGWASGHHPQIEGPESWSTACVYDFAHALDRLVAEAIRGALFEELQAVYTAPIRTLGPRDPKLFAPGFLDASVKVDGESRSLRDTILEKFVIPIEKEKQLVSNGGKLSRTTPMSAILFGPPGTSKTQLAKSISEFLGWPLLSVDPSYLIQDGLDNLYSRANRLFSTLSMAEQVVVLLDEFDEMGRDRAQSTELLSRLITTSMLPKLAAINDQRKIVFLLATNYVSNFDAAFSRGGRFDMIAQIMQPTLEAKLGKPEWSEIFEAALGKIQNAKKKQEACDALADLTYLETEQLVLRLGGQVDDVFDEFVAAAANEKCTLNRTNGKETWKATCASEESRIRIPIVTSA